jgi:ribonucleotide reductase class II
MRRRRPGDLVFRPEQRSMPSPAPIPVPSPRRRPTAERFFCRPTRRLGLAAGAIAHSTRGGIPAQELVAGDRLPSPFGTATAVAVRPGAPLPAVVVRHRYGELCLAADHPVAVVTGLRALGAKPARLLAPGDRLAWSPDGYDGIPTSLPPLEASAAFRRPSRGWAISLPDLDPEIAWLIGLIHGNGYVCAPGPHAGASRGHVAIACPATATATINRAVAALRRFGVEPRVAAGADAAIRITAYAHELARYVADHIKQPKTPLVVPDWIRNAPRDVRAGYLAGTLDSDGSVKTRPLQLVSSVYPGFVDELRRLYASLGIASEPSLRRSSQGNWRALHQLATRGMENREALIARLGPWSDKLAGAAPPKRSVDGFDLPTELVRVGLPREQRRGLTPGPTQTVAHLARIGISLPAYPLIVEEVVRSLRPLATIELELTGGGMVVVEGIVIGAGAAEALAEPRLLAG